MIYMITKFSIKTNYSHPLAVITKKCMFEVVTRYREQRIGYVKQLYVIHFYPGRVSSSRSGPRRHSLSASSENSTYSD